MTVYWMFFDRTGGSAEMESAPNLAVPERILKWRAREQCSRTYYSGVVRHPAVQPEREFPTASMSSRLLVWRRSSTQPPPGVQEQPDEVWSLTPGGALMRTPTAPPGR